MVKNGIIKRCLTCEREFYVPAYRIESAKYCSRSCLAKMHFPQFAEFRFQLTGKPPHTYKTMMVKGKQVRVHRHLMQCCVDRKLDRDEHVHHINGDPHDNRLENLMIIRNADHQRLELLSRRK